MPTREELAQQALNLSLEDRAYLADVIEQSLGGRDFETPEILSAWIAEIERRASAYAEHDLADAFDWYVAHPLRGGSCRRPAARLHEAA
jgi:2-polyprenyl-6-methoxyphenol hydroxylase-like FAD-dependent oxidoreductase